MNFFQICENVSGYIVAFEIYTGKKSKQEGSKACDTLSTKTTHLVLRLAEHARVLDAGHHLYMDNYYMSVDLLEELALRSTFACGTVRKDRKNNPMACTKPKFKKGQKWQCVWRRNESGVLAIKWFDKRPVYLLSMIHDAVEIALKKDYRGLEIVKPKAIVDYTNLMLGVDLSDQMLTYYNFSRRSTKWWRKLFIHLLNMVFTNSYVLYKKYHKGTAQDMTHSEYMNEIIHHLVSQGETVQIPRGYTQKETCDSRLTGRHFPCQIPRSTNHNKIISRKCYICSRVSKHLNDKKKCH